MNDGVQLAGLALLIIRQNLNSCAYNFQSLSVTHVYRDKNVTVDSLAKEAISMPDYKLVMEVHAKGEVTPHQEDLFFVS